MIWKTAWKNVWRNKVRSLVVILSVVVGIFAGIFAVALMNGMILQRISSAIDNEISEIQVSQKKFRDYNEMQYFLSNSSEITESIKKIEGVKAVCKRTVVAGMANSANKNSGVQIIGINPTEDRKVFDLYKSIVPGSGDFFTSKTKKKNLVVIGQDLAKELNIIRYRINDKTIDSLKSLEIPQEVIDKLLPFTDKRFKNEKLFFSAIKSVLSKNEVDDYGKKIASATKSYRKRSKVVLTFLDKDNNQTGANFKVAGIYNINNSFFEKSKVFVLNSELKPLIGLKDDEYHQIIVKINDIENTEEVLQKVKSTNSNLDVLSWRKIQPDLAMTADMVTQFYVIFLFIILLALAFGIVNTMLMVVLERTKELGMLTAIGMNKKRVFSMIMLESIFLSLTGGVFGMVISKLIISITANTGISFSSYSEGFEAMGYSSTAYPEISNDFFIIVTLMIILTGILSAIYPAYKALKLNPADAIRSE